MIAASETRQMRTVGKLRGVEAPQRSGGVAAVIATFNRLDDLKLCVDAVRAQTSRPDRVIVVDNGSTDGTPDWLATQDDLETVAFDRNLGGAGGFAAGCERGLELGTAWIWLMDDDAIPEREALGHLLGAAEEAREGVGAALPAILYSVGAAPAGYALGRQTGRPDFHPRTESTDPSWPAVRDVDWGPFLGILLNAAACREIGPIRTDFFFQHDDRDYCLRMRLAGWRVLSVPAAKMRHPAPRRWKLAIGDRELVIIPGVAPWKEYYSTRNLRVVEAATRDTEYAAAPSAAQRLANEVKLALGITLLERGGYERVLYRMRGYIDARRGRLGQLVQPGPGRRWRPQWTRLGRRFAEPFDDG
jgi:rhamnopyranosyl-N-acetylglucosaminyl-diphospho-decaprenol beta-1,3/1,4-galactofuranosyltransferase